MKELIMLYCLSTSGLNCKTVLSIAHVESGLNPNAVGKSHGEIGLFQLRPEFHECASFKPRVNTFCAINYLRKLKNRFFKKHGECYITFYNTGPNAKINYPCKHKYFKKVNKIKRSL